MVKEPSYCLAVSPDEAGYECTLAPKHVGNHIAGAGSGYRGLDNIAHVWPQETVVPMETLLVENSQEILRKWATECQRVHKENVVGDYTFTGILSEFLRDVLGYPTVTGR